MIFKLSAGKSAITAVALTAAFSLSANAVVDEFPIQSSATQAVSIQASSSSKRLIVKFKNNTQQATNSNENANASAARTTGQKMKTLRRMSTGAHVMVLEGNLSKAEVNKAKLDLASNPDIEYVEEDRLLQPMATPNDSSYNQQWHYFEPTGGLNLPTAWDTSTGAGVVVAVLDTGYRPHADLVGNILPGYDMISTAAVANDGNGRDSDARDTGDFTSAGQCGPGRPARSSSWHGTHVAGTIAAVTNNNSGVAGVAYNAKIVPVRVLGQCGGFTSDIADGMIWAAGGSVSGVPANANPAKVLNLSLGGSGACSSTSQAAINQAVSLGATVVVAAGNSNTNASNANPANCNNVVTVASTSRTGGKAGYSNFGSVVDVAAPGGQTSTGSSDGVLSTLNSGQTTPASDSLAFYQGTSMAAPHVAGAAALLYALNPSATPAAIENALKTTARSFPNTCSQCGSGIVDAAAAVASFSGNPPPTGGSVLEKGVAKTGISGAAGSEAFFTIDVPAGATNLTFNITGGTGDADLYVRFGSAPTQTSYNCRPFLSGSTESCSFAAPSTGTYHVMVRGWNAISGISLVADYTAPGQAASISESGLSASRGNWLNYQLVVPAGQSSLNVAMSGGTGDADLYVRLGSNPTTTTYNCRPYRNGNNETCTISSPAAGTWFIRIRAFSTFSGVSLNATSQ